MTSLVDPLVAARARDGVVVPLFSNLGFVPFLKNLLCSMDRVRVSNWVCLALPHAILLSRLASFLLCAYSTGGDRPRQLRVLYMLYYITVPIPQVVIALDNSTCAPIRGGFGLAYASSACVFPYAHRPLTTQGAASYRTAKIIRLVISHT